MNTRVQRQRETTFEVWAVAGDQNWSVTPHGFEAVQSAERLRDTLANHSPEADTEYRVVKRETVWTVVA